MDEVSTDIASAQSVADSAQVIANDAKAVATTAKNTANNAMPKSGGTFTGNIIACSTNRTGTNLRNISIQNSSNTEQSTKQNYYENVSR